MSGEGPREPLTPSRRAPPPPQPSPPPPARPPPVHPSSYPAHHASAVSPGLHRRNCSLAPAATPAEAPRHERRASAGGSEHAAPAAPELGSPRVCAPGMVTARKAQAVVDSSCDANREAMARAGFGVARVHIPETGVCKAMPFSPVQTVGHFLELLRLALPSTAQMRLPWSHYTLALPVRCRDARTYGCVALEARQTFSMYGLGTAGTADTVVPLLLLPEQPSPASDRGAHISSSSGSSSISSISLRGSGGSLSRSRSAAQLQHRGAGDDAAAAAGEHEGSVGLAELASAFDSTSLDSVPCVGRWLGVLPWCGEPGLSAARTRELRRLVLAGVPECIRGDVWMRLSQARTAMDHDVDNTYQVCTLAHPLSPVSPHFIVLWFVCETDNGGTVWKNTHVLRPHHPCGLVAVPPVQPALHARKRARTKGSFPCLARIRSLRQGAHILPGNELPRRHCPLLRP